MKNSHKKILLVVIVSPLILIWGLATLFSNVFSELEDWTSEILEKVGRRIARKLNITQ